VAAPAKSPDLGSRSSVPRTSVYIASSELRKEGDRGRSPSRTAVIKDRTEGWAAKVRIRGLQTKREGYYRDY
jgi:hypothetical protein